MPDNKNKQDARDRDRVAGQQDYEVQYIAEELNVTAEQVREAISAVGNSRAKIEEYLQGRENT